MAGRLALAGRRLTRHRRLGSWPCSLDTVPAGSKLGLALDSEKIGTAWLHVLSAAAVFGLTWLSKSLGPDLLIIVAAVFAAWIPAALFKRA